MATKKTKTYNFGKALEALAQKRERRREGNADARIRPVHECPIDEALKDPGAPIGQRGLL